MADAETLSELKASSSKLLEEKRAKVKQMLDNARQLSKDTRDLAKLEYVIELRAATDKMRLTNDMARKASAGVEKAENARIAELENRILEKRLENQGLDRHIEIIDAEVRMNLVLMEKLG